MKTILIGAIALSFLNLKAQDMAQPEQTVVGLFIATDQQDWERVANSFHDKVLLDYSSMNGNPAAELTPDQIISAWKGILPGFEYTHHQLGNFTSNENEDYAEVFCYGTASHYLNDVGGNLWVVVGTYDFELKKTNDDTWEITLMKFNFKYQDGNSTLPEKAMKNGK